MSRAINQDRRMRLGIHSRKLSDLAATRLARRLGPAPTLAIVLGSGFSGFFDEAVPGKRLPFSEIPGFSTASVPGHPGVVGIADIGGRPVALLGGRLHFYEGHSPETLTFPIAALARWGVRDLLLTNAAGGIRKRYRAGDFMTFRDHINFMGFNPLHGAPGGCGFVDLTNLYDRAMQDQLLAAARQARARMHRGTYIAVPGPSYETPAEIRAFEKLGADAVGMSTVPEAIVARFLGLRVAALSCITNAAAGKTATPVTHEEVLQMGQKASRTASRLLRSFIHIHSKA